MPFALSPGVTIVEKDFSSIIPAVSTSAGAFAGVFSWGPVAEPTTVSSEDILVQTFGGANDYNYKSFFSAANFLAYTNNLIVNRIDTNDLRNAVSAASGEVLNVTFATAGSGYKPGHATTVTFSAPETVGGTSATGLVILSGGIVTGIAVGTGGSGYIEAPTITISAPQVEGGQTARATATISGGIVTAITLTSGYAGSGYLTSPTITITAAPAGVGNSTATATSTIATSSISKISITSGGSGYIAAPTVTITASNTGDFGAVVVPTVVVAVVSSRTGVKIRNAAHYISHFREYQQSVFGMFAARYPGTLGNGISVVLVDRAVYANAVLYPNTFIAGTENKIKASVITSNFSGRPGTSAAAALKSIADDELHVLVLDNSRGTWSGIPYTILEKYSFLSKIRGVTRSDGTNTYYRDAINAGSKYVWVLNTPRDVQINDPQNVDWDQSINTIPNATNLRDLKSTQTVVATAVVLAGGVDDFGLYTVGGSYVDPAAAAAALESSTQNAFLQFTNTDLYDISLVIAGDVSATTANVLINNLAEVRKDCVVFISPRNSDSDGSPIINAATAAANITTFKSALTSSSYAVLDTGCKYQYDRYNDTYRWIPLNADIAGLCARTDYTTDAWFSPGGFTRGQVKNVVKLGFNPSQTERDNLYKESVNPVVTFPGQGTILYGDKTYLAKPSAFDRINVRRLFIVLEKAVATAAKYQLFEFNDDFTRAQFRNIVEPFLRNVQGRRGIIDFRVKCDSTNNTGEVIDRNEFVASIFIKPNRSINFITLNFVAARSSVSFDEIGG